MNDLRILFEAAADAGYRVHLADAGGRRLGVEVPFTPFLSEDDYEDLRWYLEEYMDLPDGGAVIRAQRIERELEQWGRQLYDALFTVTDNHDVLSELLAGPAPRRLTIATRDPVLLRLPWELTADDTGSLAQRLLVCRQLEKTKETTPRPAQLPLRILYIVSRPSGLGFIDPRLTAKTLLNALDPLGASVCVDFCRPPTVARMEEMLREGEQAGDPYDIVHFDGHGAFGVLGFEKPDDDFDVSSADFVEADRLGKVLASYTVPLVILEACRSATVDETAVSSSVAPRLIEAGVGSVLAMSHAVHVEATRLLLDHFYRELVRGTTIGQAMAEGREVLRSKPVRWLESGPTGRIIELRDWFLPQLYQSAVDETLVPSCIHIAAEDDRLRSFRSPATRDEPGSFPPPPQFGFRGRARELHALERRFRAHRGIVLHAMGGMGKTALATEAAHWWTRSGLFRDGACFLSFEQFASADRVVQVLGTYLEGQKFDQLPAVEQRRRAIELFQQNAVLMVWDNFESTLPQFNAGDHSSPYTNDERHRLAELFRDITTASGKGCLLVTCRPGETGLPGAHQYELQGLARADSLWLLASILLRDSLTLADPRLSRDKLDPLLRDLADHPLSLELVGPHLRTLTPEEICADFGRLLTRFQHEAPQERNQSLLASLEFSRRHLSAAARDALPWLGLFSGGVFEFNLLGVSQIAREAWEPIRRELESIALLRTEGDLKLGGRPFLRFHPTLSASADSDLAKNPEIRQRFMVVYGVLKEALARMLMGSQSHVALEILSREEANYRIAVKWAVAEQQFPVAADLGQIFSQFYLPMSGRLGERDAWVQWLKDAVSQKVFTEEAAIYEQENAWTRFTQGDPQGAVAQLQALVERLRHTTEFDPAFQLALATRILGRVLERTGDAQAIPVLREGVGLFETLVERAEGRPWEELLASPDHTRVAKELSNLFATMGDLAYALRNAGQYNEALAVAEKVVEIRERMGNHRDTASAYARIATILMAAGRYDEADARYRLALIAARQAGDKQVEAITLQNQGTLACERNQLERATRLYKQALELFQEAGNQGEIMLTYNALGVAEKGAGRLAEALAWYEKSRELAGQLKDRVGLAQAACNIGIVWQKEGEAAREQGSEAAAKRYFEEACRFIEESLQVWQALGDKPHEALSWGQLAEIHLHLGDLAAAERHAHEARQIRESIGLKEVWRDYHVLFEVARARSDLAAAAELKWKRDYLFAELNLASGSLPPSVLKGLQALALACARAGFKNGSFGPAEDEALTHFDRMPAPLSDFAAFLRQIAAGQMTPIPYGLPNDLRRWVEELMEAIGQAQG